MNGAGANGSHTKLPPQDSAAFASVNSPVDTPRRPSVISCRPQYTGGFPLRKVERDEVLRLVRLKGPIAPCVPLLVRPPRSEGGSMFRIQKLSRISASNGRLR